MSVMHGRRVLRHPVLEQMRALRDCTHPGFCQDGVVGSPRPPLIFPQPIVPQTDPEALDLGQHLMLAAPTLVRANLCFIAYDVQLSTQLAIGGSMPLPTGVGRGSLQRMSRT